MSRIRRGPVPITGPRSTQWPLEEVIMSKKYPTEEALKKRREYMRDWYNRPHVKEKRQSNYQKKSEEYKEKFRAYHRLKNFRLRMQVLIAYGGDPPRCSCECGCKEGRLPLLEIAHLNDDGAHHRRQLCGKNYSAGSQFYQHLKNQGFPQDVPMKVLCLICNIGKYRNAGRCPNIGVHSFEELAIIGPRVNRVGKVVPTPDAAGQLLIPFVREIEPRDKRRKQDGEG